MKFINKLRFIYRRFSLSFLAWYVIYVRNPLMQRILSRENKKKQTCITVTSDFIHFHDFNKRLSDRLHEELWTPCFLKNFVMVSQCLEDVGTKDFFSAYVSRYLPDIDFGMLRLSDFQIDGSLRCAYSLEYRSDNGSLLKLSVSLDEHFIENKKKDRMLKYMFLYRELCYYKKINMPFPINMFNYYLNNLYYNLDCLFTTPMNNKGYYTYEFYSEIGNVNTTGTVYLRKINFLNEKDRLEQE